MKSDSRDPMSCVAQNFLPGKDARSAAYQPRKHNFNLNLAKSALNLGRRHCSHRGPHSTAAARIPPRSVPLRGRIWVRSVEPSSIMEVWTLIRHGPLRGRALAQLVVSLLAGRDEILLFRTGHPNRFESVDEIT